MTAHHRTTHTRIGVPAAVVGVLATAFAAPAQAVASEPAPLPSRTNAAELGSAAAPTVSAVPAASPVPVASAVPAASPAPASYTVQSGDTIFGIAERFGLATVDVLTWNGLGWRSVIYPGQSLVLTAPAAPAANPAPTPTADPATSSSSAAIHTVVAGDTIFAIAQRHGTTVDAVLAANGMDHSSIIYPGQRLIVSVPPVTTAGTTSTLTTQTTPSTQLNAPQAENAGMIIRIGRELGVPDRGIAIALGTSMVESWLRNLDWGDRDSLGLFQQRPSTGWGTPEQIMNRDYSIRAFFTGVSAADGTVITRGLLDIPGWEGMAFADAAQAVQISAYPERYAPWESAAYEWLALYG